MTDDRGRKRDTPDGVFGAGAPRPVPRGAGLSGALPGKPRYGDNEATPGSVPISIQNEPRRTIHDPRAQERGGWDGGHRAPPQPPQPPMAAPRTPVPPPPRAPTSRAVDGYAATRPAEVVGPGARSHSVDPAPRGPSFADPRSPSMDPSPRAASFEPPARGPSFVDPRSPSMEPNPRAASFEPPARGPSFADPRTPSMEPQVPRTSLDLGSRGANAAPGTSGPGRSGSGRPNERGGGPPPARPAEPKSTLKLQLSGDTFYEAHEGRVRVPKRRGPVLIGLLVLLVMFGLGAYLWIDAHGGVGNFVAAVQKLGDSDTAVQSSVTYTDPGEQPGAGAAAQQPGAAAAVPGQQPAAAQAQQPGAQPAASQPPAAAAVANQPPAEQKPEEQATPQTGQIATGEVEAPEEAAGNAEPAKPAAATKTAQPTAAAEKPVAKPKPAAPKKPRSVVHRDPVLKVQPLGDILNAPPPDPGGGPTLPPPDPPAPE